MSPVSMRASGRRKADDPSPQDVIDELRELIAALARRVPHIERAGEIAIARDAARLKERALGRIAQLEASVT